MKQVAARLYSKIIFFFQKALKWFNRGKAAHAIGAVIKPWALHYEEDVRAIESETLNLRQHTAAAAQAELRDIHIELRQSKNELLQSRKELQIVTNEINTKSQQMINELAGTTSTPFPSSITDNILQPSEISTLSCA
jgi:hypothetical protein